MRCGVDSVHCPAGPADGFGLLLRVAGPADQLHGVDHHRSLQQILDAGTKPSQSPQEGDEEVRLAAVQHVSHVTAKGECELSGQGAEDVDGVVSADLQDALQLL